MQPAFFLDRDGVIIENRSTYVRSIADVEFLPQAIQALQRLARTSYKIIIVTNQSVVGRGHITLTTANEINRFVLEHIAEHGGRIDALYLCPHSPDQGCACRKPHPGLILQAATDLNIDLKNSIFVGDALSDIKAGRAAGIERVSLVRTGLGREQSNSHEASLYQPFLVFDDLLDAVQHFLR